MNEWDEEIRDSDLNETAPAHGDAQKHPDRPLSRAFLRETRRPILHARHFKLSKVGTVPVPAPQKRQLLNKDQLTHQNKDAIVPVRPASVPPGGNGVRNASAPGEFDDLEQNAAWICEVQRANEQKVADLRCQLALALDEHSHAKTAIQGLESQLQEEISHSLSLRSTIGQLRDLIRKRDRDVKVAKHQTALHWKGDVHAKKELEVAVNHSEDLQKKLEARDQKIRGLEDELAKERAEKDEIVRNAAVAAEEAAAYKQNALTEQAALKSRLHSLAGIMKQQLETMRKGQQDVRNDVQDLARSARADISNIALTSKREQEASDLALAKEKEAVASAQEANAQLQAEVDSLKAQIANLKQIIDDGQLQLAANQDELAAEQKEHIKSKVAGKWQHATGLSQQTKLTEAVEVELRARDARRALRRRLETLQSSNSVGPTPEMQTISTTSSLSDFPGILQIQQDLARHSSHSPQPCCPPEYLVLELIDISQGATEVALPVFQKMGQRLVQNALTHCSAHSGSTEDVRSSRGPVPSEEGHRVDGSPGEILEFRAAPPKSIEVGLLEQRVRLLRPYEIRFLHGEIILRDPDVVSLETLLRLASEEFPMDQLDSPCLVGIREPSGKCSNHGGKPMVVLDLTVQGFACEILVSVSQSSEIQSSDPVSDVDHRELALLSSAYGEASQAGSLDLTMSAGYSDPWGFSALHYAAAWGRLSVIKDILQSSPSAAIAVDAAGRFACHRALENGHLEAALLVIEKVTQSVDSDQQKRCLYDLVTSAASANGSQIKAERHAIQARLVELLIILSPKLRKIGEVSESVAEDMRRFWEQCVRALQQAVPADEVTITSGTDSQEEHGRLLHGVVAAGCPAFAIEHLINVAKEHQGVSRLMGFGIPDKEACTPTDLAASFNDAEALSVIDCLLRHCGHYSPFFLASYRPAEELEASLESLRSNDGEEHLGYHVRYHRYSDGHAALHVAAQQQDERKCFALLRAGANPDAKNHYDESPAEIFSAAAGESQTMVEVEIGTMDELESVWEALQEKHLTLARDISLGASEAEPDASNTLPAIFRGDKLFNAKAEREGNVSEAEPSALLDGPEVLIGCLGNCGLPITLVLVGGLRRIQAEACGGLPTEIPEESVCCHVMESSLTKEEADLENELDLLESGQKPESIAEKLRRLLKAAEDAGGHGSDVVKRGRQKLAAIELNDASKPDMLGACIANAHKVGVVPPVVVGAEVRFAQTMASKAKKKSSKSSVILEACDAISAMIEAPSWQKADVARVALGQLKLLVAASSGDHKLMRTALDDVSRAWASCPNDMLSAETVSSLKSETNAAELEMTVKAKAGPWADLEQSMTSGDAPDVLRKKVRATAGLSVTELKDIGKRYLIRAELDAALRSELPDPDQLAKVTSEADKLCTVRNPDFGKDIVMVDTTFAKDVTSSWRQIQGAAQALAAASATAAIPGATGGRQHLEKCVNEACIELHRICNEVASKPEVVGVSQSLISAANHQLAEAQLLSRARLGRNDKQVLREVIRTAKKSELHEPARYAREQLARLAHAKDGEAPDDEFMQI
eukprot:gnl/MRDRNA2_/MRDRNA2_73028_c0_seq1.p1 gnl/MRDRNA2_/MRDRNA2_73028_c0~~gnl/MRDRNA2_/MRDRNA2_73028_c0_seq1.p1  ORF type:complete len:1560 (+),score=374.68 gnl/MRDRNA2_/MRDRNA2_73028_c0_seq1:84-4763(+)